MVQISLFDFESPPEPISGEAFTLSPLDVLFFAPFGAIRKTGEKLTSPLITQITKLFATKPVLPSAELGLTSAGITIGRSVGAPISRPTRGILETIFKPVTKTTAPATIAVKQTNPFFPKLITPFSGKINPNLALLTGGTIAGVTGLGLLTQTEGGQELTEGIGDVGAQISKFVSKNPLIVAGIVGIALIGVIK